MKSINTINDKTNEFDKNTSPEWAVRYGYAEENNLLSLLFRLQQDNDQEAIERKFPVVEGERSVFCGDWGAFK